ncbi:MAG: penicillin-binding transpeptidase domain-containing protein [Verrucomicrobia bacterium]|nr:penicillin-binding transpeptidase domain-containing protein [Verrucomicrobiota bacterium]
MHIDELLTKLSDPAAFAWLTTGLPILFAVLVAWFALRIHTLARTRKASPAGPHRHLMSLLAFAMMAIFAYQASWQLAGFRSAEFMQFMSRYSRRVANPREGFYRGRILDRNGLILAESQPKEGRPRFYPFTPAACHVVGYAHPKYGSVGVERADDAHLSGRAIRKVENVRRFGQNLFRHGTVLGNDTVLTIDARLQVEAARLLSGKRGAVVAIDPRTGAIRLLASAPFFDPNRVADFLRDSTSPMLNRALDGLYPPGSTFKIFLAAAAIDAGKTGDIHCSAEGYSPGDGLPPIRDHEYYEALREGHTWRGHGNIDLSTALAKSSNVYFARLGPLLGAQAMNDSLDPFGLQNTPTLFVGSDGALNAKACRLPTLLGAPTRVLTQTAIGQGEVLVTPYHMARAVAVIAANGVEYRPFLRADKAPELVGRTLSAKTASTLKALMIRVVTDGTGRGMKRSGVSAGGKTGTAQNPAGDDHSWFVCFAPADRPALALVVLVENGGYGSSIAVPIAAELIKAADQYGLLAPIVETARNP